MLPVLAPLARLLPAENPPFFVTGKQAQVFQEAPTQASLAARAPRVPPSTPSTPDTLVMGDGRSSGVPGVDYPALLHPVYTCPTTPTRVHTDTPPSPHVTGTSPHVTARLPPSFTRQASSVLYPPGFPLMTARLPLMTARLPFDDRQALRGVPEVSRGEESWLFQRCY